MDDAHARSARLMDELGAKTQEAERLAAELAAAKSDLRTALQVQTRTQGQPPFGTE